MLFLWELSLLFSEINFLQQVAIVGEPQTGKTCICKQVVSDGTNFLRNYLMTHALDVSVKSINIPDTNDVIEMYLLDCSGR